MAKKKVDSTFEIIVVLAMVAIVAVTGNVLIYYDTVARTSPAQESSGFSLTGFATLEREEPASPEPVDVAISKISVDPASPMIGEPFTVTLTILNKGGEVKTPFYVTLEIEQVAETDGLSYEPLVVSTAMTKVLANGESAELSLEAVGGFGEGPVRILATADSTAKLEDASLADNQRSSTIIIAR